MNENNHHAADSGESLIAAAARALYAAKRAGRNRVCLSGTEQNMENCQ